MKKLNLFDWFLILFIIAAVSLVAFKFIKSTDNTPIVNQPTRVYKEAIVTIRAESLRRVSVDAFSIGDTVLSSETNNPIGTIEAIRIEPYEDKIEKADGTIVMAVVPERWAIEIDVKTSLLEREMGYYAQGITEIKTNSEIRFFTKYAATTGRTREIVFQ